MSRIIVATLSAIAASTFAMPSSAWAKAPATGAPGTKHVWAPADKHGFGTARAARSPVWFTLRQGSLTDVYYPDLSTPAFRGLQFAVVDPASDRVERETVDDDENHIEPLGPGITSRVDPISGTLAFRQTTRGTGWRLTKTWITDPARATVLADVRFDATTAKELYVLADPAAGNDGDDDRGRSPGNVLLSYDDDSATAVMARPAFTRSTSGYRGRSSDPWRQLQDDAAIAGTDATRPGNVVQAARTRLDGRRAKRMTLALGFGTRRNDARAAATASLRKGFDAARESYDQGWATYRAGLKSAPSSVVSHAGLRRLYDQSVLVLAASEDKRNPGASIASPSMPWVWGTLDLEEDKRYSGPYHLVWPRDLYHVATAQKVAGDDDGAARLLDYLWKTQKPDGSWWQNTRVDGTRKWEEEQMDQVALPIVLAWWLGRTGAADWARVSKAARYIVAHGPVTGQERWENQSGYSPNSIAAQIAGLVAAADIARTNGAVSEAAAYEGLADRWQQQVENWTATPNGPLSPRPYYLRVTKDGKPDQGTRYGLGDNNPGEVDQRRIVDNSFLGLVLFGVKRFDDPTVLNSLAVGDKELRETVRGATGQGWHRFSRDGYGEQATGADWLLFDEKEVDRQTRGRLWPLLAGERGEYELIAGRPAVSHLRTIAAAANDGLMLPEQVWGRTAPRGETPGAGTRSATPLAWTHAQFIRLAWSIDAGLPVERPAIVACRYQQQLCPGTGPGSVAPPSP